VTIDLDRIEQNARTIVELCRTHGLAVTGVTKGAGGHPEVARAMLRGGVSSIGDSQLASIRRLRAAGVRCSTMLLRLPALSEVDDVVDAVDVSLGSELSTLEALSAAAVRRRRVHDVIVMVDLGDLREGVWPDELVPFAREALRLPGIRMVGLGTNLACFAGVVPSEATMTRLVDLVDEVERTCGIDLPWVSGANSSGLDLIASGRMPGRVNHARIGEAILLGRETTHRRPWPGTSQDAFLLRAEVVELRTKPSVPRGPRSEDAFGRLPAFANHGQVERALLNVGREDVDVEGLTPHDAGLEILGASSSDLVVEVTGRAGRLRVGSEVTFALNYGALLSVMTSPYVDKHVVRGGATIDQGRTAGASSGIPRARHIRKSSRSTSSGAP
jgi:predicted amino acid racemase